MVAAAAAAVVVAVAAVAVAALVVLAVAALVVLVVVAAAAAAVVVYKRMVRNRFGLLFFLMLARTIARFCGLYRSRPPPSSYRLTICGHRLITQYYSS